LPYFVSTVESSRNSQRRLTGTPVLAIVGDRDVGAMDIPQRRRFLYNFPIKAAYADRSSLRIRELKPTLEFVAAAMREKETDESR